MSNSVTTTKEFFCLFCKKKIILSYQILGSASITNCSKCGSLCLLSHNDTFPLHIYSPPFKLDITSEKTEELKREQKIKTKSIEYNAHSNPSMYLIQIFPLTDLELELIFTERQVEVIKKNLSPEPLSPRDMSILSKISNKIEKIKLKYEILQNLIL